MKHNFRSALTTPGRKESSAQEEILPLEECRLAWASEWHTADLIASRSHTERMINTCLHVHTCVSVQDLSTCVSVQDLSRVRTSPSCPRTSLLFNYRWRTFKLRPWNGYLLVTGACPTGLSVKSRFLLGKLVFMLDCGLYLQTNLCTDLLVYCSLNIQRKKVK